MCYFICCSSLYANLATFNSDLCCSEIAPEMLPDRSLSITGPVCYNNKPKPQKKRKKIMQFF